MTPDIVMIPQDDPGRYYPLTDLTVYDKALRDRKHGKTHTMFMDRECVFGYASAHLILEGNEKKSRLYNAMTQETLLIDEFEQSMERLRAVTEDEDDVYYAWKHKKFMKSQEEINSFLDMWELTNDFPPELIPHHFDFHIDN
jgi:hypothetical protein